MLPDNTDTHPVPTHPVVVEFGAPHWQAHLGGGFLGPESDAALTWNWLGESPAWLVLTGLPPGTHYRATLEAAPFAPLGTDTFELAVTVSRKTILRRVVPAPDSLLSTPLPVAPSMVRDQTIATCLVPTLELPIPAGTIPRDADAAIVCAPVPPPLLRLHLNDAPLCDLSYATSPNLQVQDFTFTCPAIEASAQILHFHPGHAISPAEAGVSADTRRLSFRLFRLTLHAVPSAT